MADGRRSHLMIACGLATMSLLTVASCGDDSGARVPVADRPVTVGSVAPAASIPPSTRALSTTTPTDPPVPEAEPGATSSPSVSAPTAVLRGDGLGGVPFGTPQSDAIAALVGILGPPTPGVDIEPRAMPVVVGCARRSDVVTQFEEVIVGFTDLGGGRVLTSWMAGAVPAEFDAITLATAESVAAGADVDAVRSAYPGALDIAGQSGWQWTYTVPVATFTSGGGEIVLASSGPEGFERHTLMAGLDCRPDSSEVLAVGDEPIGLQFVARMIGDDPTTPIPDGEWTVVDHATHRPTEWTSLGGSPVAAVGPVGSVEPTMLWATRRVASPTEDALWEVTGVWAIPEGMSLFGNYECRTGMPIVDGNGELVLLVGSDPATGAITTIPSPDDLCNALGD